MTELKTTISPNDQSRLKEVRSILITQAAPEDPNSPYSKLASKYNLTIDFRPFIEIVPVTIKEFRKQKINILEHTAVIFTSRNAVDHFFKLCSESRIEVPIEMKYLCISEQTSNYLQKYIVIRKRKIFTGKATAADLADLIKKHKKERFLYPCSDIRKNDIPQMLKDNNCKFTEGIIYKTVASDLSDLSEVKYDVLAFFSPSGVDSLLSNFPDFKQNDTRIAAFGTTTSKAVEDKNLILDIVAPVPNAKSMTDAIELYVKKSNLAK